jgi:hypothetical protein
LGPIDFEVDSKIIVDKFSSQTYDATEFDDIIRHYRFLFSTYYEHFSVECIRRQANEVVHVLTKAATSLASFQLMVEIPHYIEHILSNEML